MRPDASPPDPMSWGAYPPEWDAWQTPPHPPASHQPEPAGPKPTRPLASPRHRPASSPPSAPVRRVRSARRLITMLVLALALVGLVAVGTVAVLRPHIVGSRLAADGDPSTEAAPFLDVTPTTTPPVLAPGTTAPEPATTAPDTTVQTGQRTDHGGTGTTAGTAPGSGDGAVAQLATSIARIDQGEGTPADTQVLCSWLRCDQNGRNPTRKQVRRFVSAVDSGRIDAADLATPTGFSEQQAQQFLDDLDAARGR
jgi:hypothetical protein